MILYQPSRARRSMRAFWLSVRLLLRKAAATPACTSAPHLVLHQADQRRHHDGDARQKQGRHLIADGFARTGGHHRQHILPVQQPPDDVLLPGAETVVAKNFFQDRMRSAMGASCVFQICIRIIIAQPGPKWYQIALLSSFFGRYLLVFLAFCARKCYNKNTYLHLRPILF